MSPPEDHWGLVGQQLAGRYRVDRLVEEGGFGVIYRGEHLALKKPVAIKVLKNPPEISHRAAEAFVENFTLEAQTVARLTHPHIVQVLDFGVSDMAKGGRAPWMVLEWLDGKALNKYLRARRGQPFSPPEALALMRPVFEALAHAHDERMAHRDIKPANIMILEGKRGTIPKLLDFGIAKVMEAEESVGSGHTQTQGVFQAFSPKYASPEQLSRARTGPWTDVHAMGLILTEMVTGRAAFEHDHNDTTALYSQVLSPSRPTPRAKGYDAGAWEPVLARAMALRPPDRFRDAGEFLAALLADVPAAVTGGPAPTDAFASMPDAHSAGSWGSASPSQSRSQAVPATSSTTLSGSALATAATTTPQPKARIGVLIGTVVLLLGVGAGVGVMFARRGATPPVAAAPASAGLPVVTPPGVTAPVVAATVAPVAAPPAPPVAVVAPPPVAVVAPPVVAPPPPVATPVAEASPPAPEVPAVAPEVPAAAPEHHGAVASHGTVHHGATARPTGAAATGHRRFTIE